VFEVLEIQNVLRGAEELKNLEIPNDLDDLDVFEELHILEDPDVLGVFEAHGLVDALLALEVFAELESLGLQVLEVLAAVEDPRDVVSACPLQPYV